MSYSTPASSNEVVNGPLRRGKRDELTVAAGASTRRGGRLDEKRQGGAGTPA